MNLYVGTLYTIENEFDECIQSIKQQTYKNYSSFVFRNLPNKEAHITLFRSFLDRANEFDVLVKIDADMVLTNDMLFEGIVSKLKENTWAKIISIAVHDFFSDQFIWGLNAFRNSVRWELEKENLFVDWPEVPAEKYLFDDSELAPAAIHCKNPSFFQAFHYGVHRGLKVIQPGIHEKKESSSKSHWQSLERTWLHFLKTRDIRLGLASLGAELAYRKYFRIEDLDYSNPRMKQVLEKYLLMDTKMITNEITRNRLLNFAFLPGSRRRKVLRLIYH